MATAVVLGSSIQVRKLKPGFHILSLYAKFEVPNLCKMGPKCHFPARYRIFRKDAKSTLRKMYGLLWLGHNADEILGLSLIHI